MEIRIKQGNPAEHKTEALIVTQFEGETELTGETALLDEKSGGLIGNIIRLGDFSGQLKQSAVVYPSKGFPAKRIVIAGLGKKGEFSLERLRVVYAYAVKQIHALKVQEFSFSMDFDTNGFTLAQVAESVVEGILLGLYRFNEYKTMDCRSRNGIKSFVILSRSKATCETVQSAVKIAKTVASAVFLARDLVSMPSNEMTPTDLADRTVEVMRGKKVRCEILDAGQMKELGMNALLGVARGSHEPPKLILLEYRGAKKGPLIVLVGKGITFDSGGISIKPSDKMDRMKTDMAGGAAVIAALSAAADLGLALNIVGIVPATENLPGGNAYKPGDILTSMSGKTIEIVTTDAEGRVILADALTYGCRYKPDVIIDLATLTGACIVALGEHVIGMMGTDNGLKREIRDAADITGESVWELPLWEEYHEMIEGDAADYKNSGGRPGGAITAAAFLSKFIENYPWVHLDIAGPAWFEKDGPYVPKGASGVGVRLLIHFLRNWSMIRKKNDRRAKGE